MKKEKQKLTKNLCFLAIDFQFLFFNFIKKNLKIRNSFFRINSSKINTSIVDRTFEQINSFLAYFLVQNINNDLFLLFLCRGTKWIFPFSRKKKKFILKNKFNFFSSINLFQQEWKIFKAENETKIYQYWKKNKYCLSAFLFLFYLFEKIQKKKNFLSFRIFNLISAKNFFETTTLSKELFFIAKKLKITFDTLIVGQEDFPFFHKLSEKSEGIYCRPTKNLFRIIFTEEFLDILVALYLPLIFTTQFTIRPLPTKIFNSSLYNSHKQEFGFFCHFCSSVYVYLPSNCNFCGISFVN